MGEKKKYQINRAAVIYIFSMTLFAAAAFLSAFAYKYYPRYKWIRERGESVQCKNPEIERQITWQYEWKTGYTIWRDLVNDRGELVLEGKEIDDLADVENFSELYYVALYGTGVTDLSPLLSLKNLKGLTICGGEVTDLTPVRELKGLTYLELRDLSVKSLEPLSGLGKLKILDLGNLEAEDLSPLRGLPITHIWIKDMPVTDISVFGTAKELIYFTMERTQVKDVRVLSSLWNLDSITIYDCPVEEIGDFGSKDIGHIEIINTNIDRLPALPDGLHTLILVHNKIDDFTQMVFPWELNCLELSDLPLDTRMFPLGALDVCPWLTQLTIKNAGLKDLEGISKLRCLKTLDVSGNEIADISELKEMSDTLRVLDLSGNPVRDFWALRKLRDLETLIASQIDLQEEEVQESLGYVKVENLEISGCGLNHVNFLQNTQHLCKLDASNNQIENWECLKKLENLEELDLSGNQVKDISPVEECKKLHTIDFSDNQITDIRVLENRENLYELRIKNNQIEDISVLAGCENLGTLDLSGNPLASIVGLRNLVKLNWLNLSEIHLEEMGEGKGRNELMELMKEQWMDELIMQDCSLQDLEFLPENTYLYKLDVSYNQIQKLPESRKEQRYLQEMELCGNPITKEALEAGDAFEISPGIYRMKCGGGCQVRMEEDREFIRHRYIFVMGEELRAK